MASFDIESRFTNIPLQETIDLVFFFLKMELMLIICQKNYSVSCLLGPYLISLILFDQEFYKQHDETAMGSP